MSAYFTVGKLVYLAPDLPDLNDWLGLQPAVLELVLVELALGYWAAYRVIDTYASEEHAESRAHALSNNNLGVVYAVHRAQRPAEVH